MEYQSNLTFKPFEGSLSQAFQESFVLNALSGKTGGTFLEIGGADGLEASNTFQLESNFAWHGLAIEWDPELHSKYIMNRNTSCLCVDATNWEAQSYLEKFEFSDQIDYLQIDIDPAAQSLKALYNLPFDKFRFSTITFEHDYYVTGNPSVRNDSRDFLRSHGYHLLVAGVETQGRNFEDWWIDPSVDSLLPLTAYKLTDVEASSIFKDN